MRLTLMAGLACVGLTLGISGGAVSPPAGGDVVAGSNRFALELYGALAKEPGNLFLSPASLSTALAMAHAGRLGKYGA